MNAPLTQVPGVSDKPMPHEGSALSAYIDREKAFDGIGPVAAARLYEEYGDELYTALLECYSGVVDIIGTERAVTAAAAMRERSAEIEFVDAIDNLGLYQAIGPGLTLRVARAWHDHGIRPVKTNPFNLLPLIGWKRASDVAARLGMGPNDPRRISAAVEEILRQGLENADTVMDRRRTQSAAERLAGVPVSDAAVDACFASGGALALADRLQPRGAGRMEAECALRLMELAGEAPKTDLGLVPPSDADVAAKLARIEAAGPFPLTERQRDAVMAAHRHRLLVVAGYAGTGKTTVTRAICDTLEACGRTPHIMAFTGRAAQMAREASGRETNTIAGFITVMDKANAGALGTDAVVIVDEASMLSLTDAWRILRRLGQAQLILVGDPAQLPPISFGLVFHVLAEAGGIPLVTLDRVLRQSAGSGIPVVAEAMRFGKAPALAAYGGRGDGATFTPCAAGQTLDVVDQIKADLLASDDIDDGDVQIISPVNGGPAGVDRINAHYHARTCGKGAALWPWPDPTDPARPRLAVGDPIVWTKNDRKRGFTNGSLGRIKAFAGCRVLAEIDGCPVELDADADHQYLDLAHALTVHKAQGSSWPVVIVPVFMSAIMDRSLLYTAVTRAKIQVVLVGDRAAFEAAVIAPSKALRRRVGFKTWLQCQRRSNFRPFGGAIAGHSAFGA